MRIILHSATSREKYRLTGRRSKRVSTYSRAMIPFCQRPYQNILRTEPAMRSTAESVSITVRMKMPVKLAFFLIIKVTKV